MTPKQALAVTKLLASGHTCEFQEAHKKFIVFVPAANRPISVSLSSGEDVIISPDGKLIYINAEGKYHRVGKPAVVYPNGDVEFWEDDMFVRGVASGEIYF
mgnify:CR=1 FL=1|jgi:hypothetical protein